MRYWTVFRLSKLYMQKNKLVDELVEECTEADNEVKLARITLAYYENEFKSFCTLYIVLFSVLLTISIGISTIFVYFNWYSKNEVNTNINPNSNLLNIINGKY